MAGTKAPPARTATAAAKRSQRTPPAAEQGQGDQAAGQPSRRSGAKGKGQARGKAERPDWPRDGTRGLLAPADTRRPHVRLGAVWFVVAVGSLAGGPLGVAATYGAAAALGAAQTARAWRRAGRRPSVATAAALAALLPTLTAYASWGLGAAILLGVAVSVVGARGTTRVILADGSATIRCWLFLGIAAASVVAIARMELGAALALIVLTSVYDCGNYLVGSESRWPWTGILAGAAAVGVVTFSLFVVALPPFGGPAVVPFGVAVALLAPLGQIAAAYVLPDGRALASGLRRLDAVLLVGPAWLVLFAVAPPG